MTFQLIFYIAVTHHLVYFEVSMSCEKVITEYKLFIACMKVKSLVLSEGVQTKAMSLQ